MCEANKNPDLDNLEFAKFCIQTATDDIARIDRKAGFVIAIAFGMSGFFTHGFFEAVLGENESDLRAPWFALLAIVGILNLLLWTVVLRPNILFTPPKPRKPPNSSDSLNILWPRRSPALNDSDQRQYNANGLRLSGEEMLRKCGSSLFKLHWQIQRKYAVYRFAMVSIVIQAIALICVLIFGLFLHICATAA